MDDNKLDTLLNLMLVNQKMMNTLLTQNTNNVQSLPSNTQVQIASSSTVQTPKVLPNNQNKIGNANPYPFLSKPASYFDTPQKRMAWWNALEEGWKSVFKKIYKVKKSPITDDIIEVIFQSHKLDLTKYQINLRNNKVDNLLGISNLTELVELNVSNMGLMTLKGIEYLDDLETLHAYSNNLKTIVHLASLKNLKIAWLNGNDDLSISDIRKLRNQNINVSFHRNY